MTLNLKFDYLLTLNPEPYEPWTLNPRPSTWASTPWTKRRTWRWMQKSRPWQ